MRTVELYPHNQEAYKKIKQSIANGDKKIAISHATGTGKSYLIAKLCEDYNEDKKLVLVPSRHIKKEIKSLLKENYIKNVDVKLYQGLIKMSDEYISAMNYKIVALDEYHHDTAKVWGYKVRILIDSHHETIFFGTSATPVRTDGINVIDKLFDGNCVSNISLPQAIVRGIVPCPKYVAAFYTLDERLNELRRKIEKSTNSKEEKDEFYEKINTMRSQIEKSYGMPIILNNNIKDREGRYIVFCKNKKHLEKVKETVIDWFKTAGFKNINSYVVHSSYESKDEEYEAFCNDTSHSLKLLFCINMLNEGSHKTNISGALLLRKTNSYIMLLQQIGRTIESGKTNNPIIIDAVNNFIYVKDGIKLLTEIKEAIEEEKKTNKDFDESKFIDIDTFFVTEYVQNIEDILNEINSELRLNCREWTKEEDEILIKYFPIEGYRVISRLKDRNKNSCHSRIKILGLKFNKRPMKWDESEDIIIKKYYPIEGVKVSNRLINRTEYACGARAKKIGITKDYKNWTKEEDEILKKYYPIEKGKCYSRLNNRNKSACAARVSLLGLSKKASKWTKNEIETLIKYYPVEGSEVYKRFKDKTRESCSAKACQLKIKFSTKKYKHVYFRDGKYIVSFCINGKTIYFGSYDTEDEAGRVAIEKAKELGKAI